MKMRNLVVGGLALAFALSTSTVAIALQGKKGALEAVDKLAKKAKDASFAEDCKSAAKGLELDPVMHSFKPRARGGFGIGGKAGLVPANQDGIEAYLPALSKKGLSAADAGKMGEPVIEMANRVLAIAEVSDHLARKAAGGVPKSGIGRCSQPTPAAARSAGSPAAPRAASSPVSASVSTRLGRQPSTTARSPA